MKVKTASLGTLSLCESDVDQPAIGMITCEVKVLRLYESTRRTSDYGPVFLVENYFIRDCLDE